MQSARTPFTKLGANKSTYGGRNKTVINWYANTINDKDNYSMFSKKAPTMIEKSIQEDKDQDLMNSLKQNKFLPAETFEEFLDKVTRKKGKRTTFKKLDAVGVKDIYQENFNTKMNFYNTKVADRSRER